MVRFISTTFLRRKLPFHCLTVCLVSQSSQSLLLPPELLTSDSGLNSFHLASTLHPTTFLPVPIALSSTSYLSLWPIAAVQPMLAFSFPNSLVMLLLLRLQVRRIPSRPIVNEPLTAPSVWASLVCWAVRRSSNPPLLHHPPFRSTVQTASCAKGDTKTGRNLSAAFRLETSVTAWVHSVHTQISIGPSGSCGHRHAYSTSHSDVQRLSGL